MESTNKEVKTSSFTKKDSKSKQDWIRVFLYGNRMKSLPGHSLFTVWEKDWEYLGVHRTRLGDFGFVTVNGYPAAFKTNGNTVSPGKLVGELYRVSPAFYKKLVEENVHTNVSHAVRIRIEDVKKKAITFLLIDEPQFSERVKPIAITLAKVYDWKAYINNGRPLQEQITQQKKEEKKDVTVITPAKQVVPTVYNPVMVVDGKTINKDTVAYNLYTIIEDFDYLFQEKDLADSERAKLFLEAVEELRSIAKQVTGVM